MWKRVEIAPASRGVMAESLDANDHLFRAKVAEAVISGGISTVHTECPRMRRIRSGSQTTDGHMAKIRNLKGASIWSRNMRWFDQTAKR